MSNLIIILVIIVGGVLGWYFGRRKKEKLVSKHISSRDSESEEVKQGNREKILKFMQENQKVTNNDVEKLIGVSDATATRYLDELEKEEKINQIGMTGQGVYYVLK